MSDPPKAEDFFLGAANAGDHVRFLAPSRSGSLVEPLVDGTAAFQAMEEAMAAATKSIYLTFWIFNPRTPVLSGNVRMPGVRNWVQLLRDKAAKDVDVRIILTEFDPVLQSHWHEYNWRAYEQMMSEVVRLAGAKRDRFQFICSMHESSVELGFLQSVWYNNKLGSLLKVLNAEAKANRIRRYRRMPGLWKNTTFDSKSSQVASAAKVDATIYPACHHQKSCVIDGEVGFCGGLDVNTGRIDTPAHTHTKKMPWHDLHCRVKGEAARDMERNFIGRWNREMPLFKTYLKAINASASIAKVTATSLTAITHPATWPKSTPGKSVAQIHRTLSKGMSTAYVPTTLRDDIEKSYQKVIGQAREFVYIENQYVRAEVLADWLVARKKAVPKLAVIIVLPVAPEEVGMKGGPDEVTNHGLYLQHKVLTRLKTELGKNIGIYSMVQKRSRGGKGHATDMYGSPQIYVHSKLIIVDDMFASIGSANTNLRSFRIDTEMAAGWVEKSSVRALRLHLWRELLGGPSGMASWTPADFIREWDKIASANAKAGDPKKRQGFVVSHDINKFKGSKSSLIKDVLAELHDADPEYRPDSATA